MLFFFLYLQIEFLRCKKPFSLDISECIGKFFTGEALANFSWKCIRTSDKARNAMTDYHIFTSCMLGMCVLRVIATDVRAYFIPFISTSSVSGCFISLQKHGKRKA